LKLKYLPLLALLALPCRADQVASTEFKGLNNNENSTIIEPSYAQDLLNVDVTPGGKSVKKRSGYGLYKALSTSQPMRGGYHAFDSTGNDYQIWGSSKSLYGIVSDGTPLQLVSSATLNSTWDCTDTQGNSYCVNSNRDVYLKTDGTTKTWYTSPLGTMIESTPDRVIVAGVSGSPNTLYVSQANTFTNFTVGTNATDAFTEVIASPGSKLTHIRWGCGKLLWWKDASFGYFDFDDQFNAQVKTVSDSIGTFDNTSAIDPGGQVWFRGQDGHTWKYDCSVLTKESIDITPNIQVTGKRVSNLWTQTSQSDWQAGAVTFNGPSPSLSTTTAAGDVVPSSFTASDTTTTDFSSGTYIPNSIDTTTVSGAIALRTYLNDTFSNFSNWSETCGTVSTSGGDADFTSANHVFQTASIYNQTGDIVAQFDFRDTDASANGEGIQFMLSTATTGGYVVTVFAKSGSGNYSLFISSTASNNTWNDGTSTCNSPGINTGASGPVRFISSTTVASYDTATHTIKIVRDNSTGSTQVYWDGVQKLSVTDTNFTTFRNAYFAATQATGLGHWHIDNFYLVARKGNFTSRLFDTGFFTPVYGVLNVTGAGSGTYSYATRSSSSTTGVFTADVAVSSGAQISSTSNRYILYSATMTSPGNVTNLPQITDVYFVNSSTGIFYSQVHNSPNLTAWSTFGANRVLNDGTETFYIRSSTNNFSVLSSTPTWTAQSIGGLISVSTGTYYQVRDDFSLTTGTQAPTLNDFTVNFFEGSSSDQAYMLYFDNAIWESVAFGSGQAVNNYIFKRDLINDSWTQYNFGAGGLLVQGNRLYFGDTSTSNVYVYGSAISDNGTAINAYWRTKTFTGQDPFLQNQLTQIDTFSKKDQGSTLTASYTLDTSTSPTTYSINLSSTTNNVVQSRKLLPGGKLGYTFDLKYEDTSASSSWEIFGYRIGFIQLPYRSTP